MPEVIPLEMLAHKLQVVEVVLVQLVVLALRGLLPVTVVLGKIGSH
jgi:hypothetical protein